MAKTDEELVREIGREKMDGLYLQVPYTRVVREKCYLYVPLYENVPDARWDYFDSAEWDADEYVGNILDEIAEGYDVLDIYTPVSDAIDPEVDISCCDGYARSYAGESETWRVHLDGYDGMTCEIVDKHEIQDSISIV